ncbi:uncharacterized protein M8220_003465 isoform 1-T5 [Acridotheres tristis]
MDKDLEKASRCICAGYRTEFCQMYSPGYIFAALLSDSTHKKALLYYFGCRCWKMKFCSTSRQVNLHPAMCREAAEMLGQRGWGNTKKFLTPCRAQSVNTKKREDEEGLCLLSCTSTAISGIILIC